MILQAEATSSSESEHSESTLPTTSTDRDTSSPVEQYESSDQIDQIEALPSTQTSRWNAVTITEVILQVTLWFTMWAFFTHLEFGAPYFVISLIYVLYRSLRTGPKEENRLSAYSVFNPNCERLDGTFTAEQFERELRYGPAAVR